MTKEKIILSTILLHFALISSCDQQEYSDTPLETKEFTVEQAAPKKSEQHQYGSWYCPDNLHGFPPMDIQDFDKLTIINDRLPTLEETRNGTSLIYIDTKEYSNAKPLEMRLPKVANYYSPHSKMNELIIVIQAVIIDKDTVVGFRYPNGGNGSAWFGEVSFLSDEELNEIGPSPFVYIEEKLDASKEKIWRAITQTSYAKDVGMKFKQESFFESHWNDDAYAELDYGSANESAKGMVASMWGNLYLQIDYNQNGFHHTEKILVIENPEDNSAQLHIVMGPYPTDLKSQKTRWNKWLQEVKSLSEID